MWHVGIDLHRRTVVLAAVNDAGDAMNPITIPCSDTATIANAVKALGAFPRSLRPGHLSLVVRFAPSLRHDPLGPSAPSASHGTTPLEDRQAGRPVVGEPAADQPDSAGLHSAGALSAVARPRARQGAVGPRTGGDLLETVASLATRTNEGTDTTEGAHHAAQASLPSYLGGLVPPTRGLIAAPWTPR